MLNIFKNFVSKTSILDDFDFYESRQKVMQEKRTRHSIPQYNLQVLPSFVMLHSFQQLIWFSIFLILFEVFNQSIYYIVWGALLA